jgi:glycosyltransferase involved in cell wall biosynthesis
MNKGELEIFIITYNRASMLKETLTALAKSRFCSCNITIMDNCSTDDTIKIYESFVSHFKSISCISHNSNIGAGPNILRSIENSRSEYCWVLCDDDTYDFSQTEDVFQKIEEGRVDLIHVGAHNEPWIHGGVEDSPSNLLKMGYHYFKYGSFIPCNIIKTEVFTKKYLIAGYNNVINAYPHMPFLQGLYAQHKSVYIAKNRIVVAGTGPRFYDPYTWLIWWMRTADTANRTVDKRRVFLNQFTGGLDFADRLLIASASMGDLKSYFEIKSFLLRSSLSYTFLTLEVYILVVMINKAFSGLMASKLWGVILYYKNKFR